jgi:hypothetical protein
MMGMLCGRWDGKLLPLFLATYEPRFEPGNSFRQQPLD